MGYNETIAEYEAVQAVENENLEWACCELEKANEYIYKLTKVIEDREEEARKLRNQLLGARMAVGSRIK